jgi:hypothetical protein
LKIGFVWMSVFLLAACAVFLWLPRTVTNVIFFVFTAMVGFIAPLIFEIAKNGIETLNEQKREKKEEERKRAVGDLRKR